MSQSSEFDRYNTLCCFSMSVCCCLFRYDSVRKLLDTPSQFVTGHWTELWRIDSNVQQKLSKTKSENRKPAFIGKFSRSVNMNAQIQIKLPLINRKNLTRKRLTTNQ